jgi:hypothetical protein
VGGEAGCVPPVVGLMSATAGDAQVTLSWQAILGDPAVLGYNLYYDQAGKAQWVATLNDPASDGHVDTGLTNGQAYCYKVTALYDCDGDRAADAESAFSDILCAVPTNPGQAMTAGVDEMRTGTWVTSGKGKNQTTEFQLTDTFSAGDSVVVQAHVVDEVGAALAGATVELIVVGPDGGVVATLLTGSSDSAGWAEAVWSTQKPNKKGAGGTVPGTYEAAVHHVTVSGYVWDEARASALFRIQ